MSMTRQLQMMNDIIEDLQYIAIGPGTSTSSSVSKDDIFRVDEVCRRVTENPYIAARILEIIEDYSTSKNSATCMGKVYSSCDAAVSKNINNPDPDAHVFVYHDTWSQPIHQSQVPGSSKALLYNHGMEPCLRKSHRTTMGYIGIHEVRMMYKTKYGYVSDTSRYTDINNIDLLDDTHDVEDLMVLLVFIGALIVYLVNQ